MLNATPFPREDFLSHLLPQHPYRLYGSLSADRIRPALLKVCSVSNANQASRAKPLYEPLEIRDEFPRFSVYDWTGVQEVEHHIVPQEQKSVFPVRRLSCLLHSLVL